MPLCAGTVDAIESEKLRIFGPNKAACRLEGSLQAICAEGNGALVGSENIVYILIHLKSLLRVF